MLVEASQKDDEDDYGENQTGRGDENVDVQTAMIPAARDLYDDQTQQCNYKLANAHQAKLGADKFSVEEGFFGGVRYLCHCSGDCVVVVAVDDDGAQRGGNLPLFSLLSDKGSLFNCLEHEFFSTSAAFPCCPAE